MQLDSIEKYYMLNIYYNFDIILYLLFIFLKKIFLKKIFKIFFG